MAGSLASAETDRLRVGEWQVDLRRNLISSAERAIRLEPKVVELLVNLARRPGEVISREELLTAVWPNVVVGDETLTQAVNKLRRSLGDDVHSPTYIETVSKRGYRLVAKVTPTAPDSSRPLRRRWPWLAALSSVGGIALVLLVVNARWPIMGDDYPGARDSLPIVAVLPLANQGGDSSREYFSDGVTEDLISALGRFPGLRVISRSSVEQYKGQPVQPRVIRDALGARYIVSGSLRESDGRLRIAVELSDAVRGIVLWSQRFDGTGKDVFVIQDQIVKNIVGRLAVKVTQLEQARAARRPASNLEAYDLVLRSRPLTRESRAANRRAREMLDRALQLAPDYAEAHVMLALAEMTQIEYGWVEQPDDLLARLEKRLHAALAIDDPGVNARVHGLLAGVHSMRGDFDQALIEIDRALEANPSDAFALRARSYTLTFLGRIDEAIATFEMARRFDPAGSVATGFISSLAYYTAGRYAEALAAADITLMKYPHNSALHALRAATLAQMGEENAAREAAARLMQLEPVFPVRQFGSRFRDPKHAAHLQDGLRKAGL